MENAAIYFGSLKSSFAREQDWEKFSLGIFASEHLDLVQNKGIQVFSYSHKDDSNLKNKIDDMNNGIFLDWASVPNGFINDLAQKLHRAGKKIIVNTGWGLHSRSDYGNADILLLESFLGMNSGDDGVWPVKYSRTDEGADIRKLRALKEKGYKSITLSYGPSADMNFANYCRNIAEQNCADFFIYCQAPGWEKEGSGFKLFGED
ncbi:hypothetical protein ACFL6I_09650 [candidate division KSB1 bacterium]